MESAVSEDVQEDKVVKEVVSSPAHEVVDPETGCWRAAIREENLHV